MISGVNKLLGVASPLAQCPCRERSLPRVYRDTRHGLLITFVVVYCMHVVKHGQYLCVFSHLHLPYKPAGRLGSAATQVVSLGVCSACST